MHDSKAFGSRNDLKFIFLKTHKTGSSTVANIMHNLVVSYGLKVVPVSKKIPGLLWTCKIYRRFRQLDEPADVWANHVRYHPNDKCLEEMVPGGNFLTILREPLTRYISAVRYFYPEKLLQHNCDFDQYIKNVGCQSDLVEDMCRTTGITNQFDQKGIDRVLEYDILFQEDLDASLEYWRQKYKLQVRDIHEAKFKQNDSMKCHVDINSLSDETVQKIYSCNQCDKKLYDLAWNQWEEIKAESGPFVKSENSSCEDLSNKLCKSFHLDNKEWLRTFQDEFAAKSKFVREEAASMA